MKKVCSASRGLEIIKNSIIRELGTKDRDYTRLADFLKEEIPGKLCLAKQKVSGIAESRKCDSSIRKKKQLGTVYIKSMSSV